MLYSNMQSPDPILLSRFAAQYEGVSSDTREDPITYSAYWPDSTTRIDVMLVLLRQEMEHRSFEWLRNLIGLVVQHAGANKTVNLLRDIYRDRCDLNIASTWSDFSALGFTASKLRLMLEDDALYLGEVIKRKWRIENRVAEGGMSIVYCGVNLHDDSLVAIKAQRFRDAKKEKEYSSKMRTEYSFLSKHVIIGVPRVYAHALVRKLFIIIMEWIDGVCLHKLRGTLALRDTLLLYSRIAGIVDEIHRLEYVHGDLKSNNIIVSNKGIPYVIDYNLVQHMHVAKWPSILLFPSLLEYSSRYQGGTVGWMGPEIEVWKRPYLDGRQDLFSLGVLLYEMCIPTGPATAAIEYYHLCLDISPICYEGPIDYSLPYCIDEMCRYLVDPSPLKRYETAAEVVQVCQRLLQNDDINDKVLPQPSRNVRLIAWRLGNAIGNIAIHTRKLGRILPSFMLGRPNAKLIEIHRNALKSCGLISHNYKNLVDLAKELKVTLEPWQDAEEFEHVFNNNDIWIYRSLRLLPKAYLRLVKWLLEAYRVLRNATSTWDKAAYYAMRASWTARYLQWDGTSRSRFMKHLARCKFPRKVVAPMIKAIQIGEDDDFMLYHVSDLDYRVIRILRWN